MQVARVYASALEESALSRERSVRGLFAVQVVVVLTTNHGVRLLSTTEAARLIGVTEGAIRYWRRRPLDLDDPDGPRLLEPQGLDERKRPLHTASAVRDAERVLRQDGIDRAGVDPRDLRKPKPRANAALRPQARQAGSATLASPIRAPARRRKHRPSWWPQWPHRQRP